MVLCIAVNEGAITKSVERDASARALRPSFRDLVIGRFRLVENNLVNLLA